jgi:ribosome biogenesis protein SSF1/2
MAGPLGVSHLLLFSRSEAGNTNLRLARIPRGPTLHFRVEKYSLAKDIMNSLKHPRAGANDYDMAPLLVMNNFITTDAEREKLGDKAPPKHLEKLVTDMFQGLFPPIQPHATPLQSIKRVLLLNREPPSEENGTCTISLRHYAITTKITGLPKAIRRLHAAEKLIGSREKKKRGLPNLGALNDVADYMLDPSAAGYTSASDTEADTDAEVEVATAVRQKVMSKRDRERVKAAGDDARKPSASRPKVEKRAVKLIELGPRMKLRLTKVEEDICSGKIMWHEYVTKSASEVKEMDKTWEKRNAEKAERRRVQKENIEKKRKERGQQKGQGEEEGEDDDEEMEDFDEYDMDDDVWHDEDGEGEDGEEDGNMEE